MTSSNTDQSVLIIVGPKYTLAASHSLPCWVTLTMRRAPF